MYILHCLKKSTWEACKGQAYYGRRSLEACGFIHCSEIDTYADVAPNFADEPDALVLLVIDTEQVKVPIKWENGEGYETKYPHIYGLLNTDAIVAVLPHLWDGDKNWVPNDELKAFCG